MDFPVFSEILNRVYDSSYLYSSYLLLIIYMYTMNKYYNITLNFIIPKLQNPETDKRLISGNIRDNSIRYSLSNDIHSTKKNQHFFIIFYIFFLT